MGCTEASSYLKVPAIHQEKCPFQTFLTPGILRKMCNDLLKNKILDYLFRVIKMQKTCTLSCHGFLFVCYFLSLSSVLFNFLFFCSLFFVLSRFHLEFPLRCLIIVFSQVGFLFPLQSSPIVFVFTFAIVSPVSC